MPAVQERTSRGGRGDIIDLTEPRPGSLGDRLRQLEGRHPPGAGTLGHRLRLARRSDGGWMELARVI